VTSGGWGKKGRKIILKIIFFSLEFEARKITSEIDALQNFLQTNFEVVSMSQACS
jgi:hypothetical protein